MQFQRPPFPGALAKTLTDIGCDLGFNVIGAAGETREQITFECPRLRRNPRQLFQRTVGRGAVLQRLETSNQQH
jgi:hypothetical protein